VPRFSCAVAAKSECAATPAKRRRNYPLPPLPPPSPEAGFFVASSPRPRNALYAVFWPSWHKAVAIDSDIPAPNRFLIFMYPSKEVADKVQNDTIKPWAEKVKGKYVERYRVFGVEAVEQK
jgi:hypothetical protein